MLDLMQCIITIPNEYAQDSSFTQTLEISETLGDISALKLRGNTIVFDSFSSEDEVKRRNTRINTVSRLNDSTCQFQTDFNICFSSVTAAVLSPSMVPSYRIVDRRGLAVLATDKRPEHIKEALKHKRRTSESPSIETSYVGQWTGPLNDESEVENLQLLIEHQLQRNSILLKDSIPFAYVKEALAVIDNEKLAEIPNNKDKFPQLFDLTMTNASYAEITRNNQTSTMLLNDSQSCLVIPPLYPTPYHPSVAWEMKSSEPSKRSKLAPTFDQALMSHPLKCALPGYKESSSPSSTELLMCNWPSAFSPFSGKEKIAISALQELATKGN